MSSTRLLFAHATGLCSEVWRNVIHAKDSDLLRYAVRAFDFRGHGSRGGECLTGTSGPPSWDDFAVADVLEAASSLRVGGGGGCCRVVGVGHSMGGAALVKAELAAPGTFAALVLCEPILISNDIPFYEEDGEEAGKGGVVAASPNISTAASGSKRRKSSFSSHGRG